MKALLGVALLLSTAMVAAAQTSDFSGRDAGSSKTDGPWHVDFSLMNAFDGNVDHDVVPVRSYGVAPAAAFRYERAGVFALGYDIALNNYTGTDEWDRVSHGLYATMTRRIGRLRFETGGNATWKGSSEDRELSNEFGVSQRVAYRPSDATRLVLNAVYRYRQYPDDPDASGVSPGIGGKFEYRFGEDRLTFGYKFQTRHSRVQRDRYRRHAYSVAFSMPIDLPDDALSFEFEYRPQRYDRLIKVGDARVYREDRRATLAAVYERPVSPSLNIIWLAALEARDSNDPDKRYTAPSIAMTLRYRWR